MAGCAAAFVYQLSLGPALEGLVMELGFVPARFTEALAGERPLELVLFTLASSAFLHGGWFHILGNLLYLRVFGDNVEDRLGHPLFILFYLVSAAAGCLAQWFFDPYSQVPMVGASGAIAGVLGAYIVMFPRARILTVFPVFIVLTFIEVPAFFFLGIWALQQFLNGFLALSQSTDQAGGIAWFAHIGGFAVGLLGGVLGRALHRIRRRRRAAKG